MTSVHARSSAASGWAFWASGRFSGRRGRGGAPDWRAHLSRGDTRHGFGERGEVEACQVIHDVFAHAR
jgi:hypothetical protein